jgi:hypothetical protein
VTAGAQSYALANNGEDEQPLDAMSDESGSGNAKWQL